MSDGNNGSHNIHFNYPPLMEDSRLFSDYHSSVFNDKVLKENNNIQTNSDYRKYLQVNADAIIKNNQLNSCGESPYYTQTSFTTNHKTPYIFDSTLSSSDLIDTSDLKDLYLSRQRLDSQKHVTKYVISENK